MCSANRVLTVRVPQTVALQYVFRTLLSYIYKKHRLPFYEPSQNCEKRLLASSCLSVWDNWAPTGRIFVIFYIRDFS